MRRHWCENSACAGPIMRDDYDAAYCRTCGSLFCCETCRDDHVAQQHPQAKEFEQRFGFPIHEAAE